MKYDSFWYKIWDKITNVVAKISWCPGRALFNGGKYWSLTEADHSFLRHELRKNYFIICTARSCHLTTYLIRILSALKGDNKSYYSHSLMNTENGTAENDEEFKLMEATGKGVHYSTFMEIFDCDAVALLKPKNMTLTDWTAAIDAARKQDGLPYDDIFDLLDDTHVSCVEMVWQALKKVPDYQLKFPHLTEMIKNVGNLTPHMLRNCQDFEVYWEVRR